MAESEKTKKKCTSGTGRIHKRPSGAISIYADQEIGKANPFPLNARVKIVVNHEKNEIIIRNWEESE